MLACAASPRACAMLTDLHIRNYAIVESLDLDLEDGFTCITGETGAGKSILVGALGLLCGDRADSSAVRAGRTTRVSRCGSHLGNGPQR